MAPSTAGYDAEDIELRIHLDIQDVFADLFEADDELEASLPLHSSISIPSYRVTDSLCCPLRRSSWRRATRPRPRTRPSPNGHSRLSAPSASASSRRQSRLCYRTAWILPPNDRASTMLRELQETTARCGGISLTLSRLFAQHNCSCCQEFALRPVLPRAIHHSSLHLPPSDILR